MTQSKSTKKKINELDFLKQIMGTYLQEYLEQEMSHHLNALPYLGSLTKFPIDHLLQTIFQ